MPDQRYCGRTPSSGSVSPFHLEAIRPFNRMAMITSTRHIPGIENVHIHGGPFFHIRLTDLNFISASSFTDS